jgi:hypothetical protein
MFANRQDPVKAEGSGLLLGVGVDLGLAGRVDQDTLKRQINGLQGQSLGRLIQFQFNVDLSREPQIGHVRRDVDAVVLWHGACGQLRYRVTAGGSMTLQGAFGLTR